MIRKIVFIGGDHRQTVALSLLSEKYEVAAVGFDGFSGELGNAVRVEELEKAVNGAFAVVLPLPYTRDKLHIFAPLCSSEILVEDVLAAAVPTARIYGGMLDDYITARARNAVDYYESEELQIMNSVPTAEGAIAIAMEELPITLFDAKAVVIGFGRVAKLLAHRLCSLGVKVTVCARREDDRAYARAYGYDTVDFGVLGEAMGEADVIFNSVPHHVITPDMYRYIRHGTPLIDLASRPGGLDFERAKQYGLNVIWALSLPGKVAPVTAGRIIADTLEKLIMRDNDNE